jgi:5'-deoxynucleotidase YfbR-like HD superfamily hydrolase
MDTGKRYNGGEGLTAGCFYALDFIRHYGRVQTGSNISVAMHSYQTAIIGSKWYKFQEDQGYQWEINQGDFTTACLFHDISEAFVGDTWRPVKTPEVKEQENRVHEDVMKYLNIDTKVDTEVAIQVKSVDTCAQFVELVRYLEISPNHAVFTRIARDMATDVTDRGMRDFVLNDLRMKDHPVAVSLI